MTSTPEKQPRQMPKGGRKGGSVFPRVPLVEALAYAKKLVSKTHTGPQSNDVILMGVIGSRHEKGKYGMSALKQYGLLVGDTKSNFSASDLAKKIAAAPPDEVVPLYRIAALKAAVFKSLFETYHGDTVSKAKLKQRAADLKVHPDETLNCVEIYVASMATAELVSVAGDQITHLASSDAIKSFEPRGEEMDSAETDKEAASDALTEEDLASADASKPLGKDRKNFERSTDKPREEGNGGLAPRAVFNVNVTLDASLDVEKLEKQLSLLRRYGAL